MTIEIMCDPPKALSRPLRTLPCACCPGISSIEVDPNRFPGLYGPYCGEGECGCEVREEHLQDVKCPPTSFRRILELRPKRYEMYELPTRK